MERGSRGRSGGLSGAVEGAGRCVDLEPELAVDSATRAWPRRSEAILVHAVHKWMRIAGPNGSGLAGPRRGIEYSSDQPGSFVPARLRCAPTELASAAAAYGAASRTAFIVD